MKVAIASSGTTLDSAVDPRFGRCACFLVCETDDSSLVEVIPNTAAAQGSGAGIAAAQLVADTGVEAVIGSRFGPNAFQALGGGGIAVYECMGGTVLDALAALTAGQLQQIAGPTVQAHYGTSGGVAGPASGPAAGPGLGGGVGGGVGGGGMAMGGGVGRGMGGGMGMGGGIGMGGGMGRGRGGGGGRGGGMGMGVQAMPTGAPQDANAVDSAVLRQITDMVNELSKQVGALNERISQIEKRL